MPQFLRSFPRSLSAIPAWLALLALACATTSPSSAEAQSPASSGRRMRQVTASQREYADFLAALDSSWIAFDRGSAALSPLDSVVLADLAEVLQYNPQLRLGVWASAPEAAPAGGRPTGSDTELARRRREAVRGFLLGRGVYDHQLRTRADDPGALPRAFDWRSTGGTVFFVAGHAERFVTPNVRVHVRAAPGSQVFFIPRSLVEPGSARMLCAPPPAARRGQTATDSILEGNYPPRPIVGVARDTSGVVRTRQHDVNPRNDPDMIDFTRELPDPRCR